MILIKGTNVRLELSDNQGWINLPVSYGIIHDPDGRQLPKCSVFVGPFKKTQTKLPPTKAAIEYFGKSHIGRDGIISMPDGPWKHIGNVVQIWYKRPGKYQAKYYHFFKKNTTVTLAKCGKYFKIGLQNGCLVNWRGFVYP